MRSFMLPALLALNVFLLAGCASNYSPNTYASNAVQLANKVETAIVVGFREVHISAAGTIGAVTGGAAGGVLGAQYADSALIAVGGSAVGALVGSALDHAAGDTMGWEYIVRKTNGDMLSVTQRETTPLPLGQKVLVIMGPQARVVADYSVIPETPPAVVKAEEPKPQPPIKVEVVLSVPPGATTQQIKVEQAEVKPEPEPGIVSVSATPEDLLTGISAAEEADSGQLQADEDHGAAGVAVIER